MTCTLGAFPGGFDGTEGKFGGTDLDLKVRSDSSETAIVDTTYFVHSKILLKFDILLSFLQGKLKVNKNTLHLISSL